MDAIEAFPRIAQQSIVSPPPPPEIPESVPNSQSPEKFLEKSSVGVKYWSDNLSEKPELNNPNASPSDVDTAFQQPPSKKPEVKNINTSPSDVDTTFQQSLSKKPEVKNLNTSPSDINNAFQQSLSKKPEVKNLNASPSDINTAFQQSLSKKPEVKNLNASPSDVNAAFQQSSSKTPKVNNPNPKPSDTRKFTTIPEEPPSPQLSTFSFDVITLDVKKSGLFGLGTKQVTTNYHQGQAQYFTEDLGQGVNLEMVVIPAGSFWMGSPDTEESRHKNESPRHKVTVASFCFGKYPVTQAQWQAVAALPQVNRQLKPNPSRFKGKELPVENVPWYSTIEFCARLSQKTGREYRLPSEAEWEYACRAGTYTPFHLGETISPELANYNANYTYGSGSQGKYRKQTTPVGRFKVANTFGLYDMHGNVWEWCADHWHGNYKGAPIDGSVWLSKNEYDSQKRILRGGSWLINPRSCRSADRIRYELGVRNDFIGFRVACPAAWTP
ncbi:MAG: formylglycine-generating enzyme family protein [Symploca sp. SIO2D2]|nr:formylglycine-generating enzyme family protein [Symploca sp. SIO2D2]